MEIIKRIFKNIKKMIMIEKQKKSLEKLLQIKICDVDSKDDYVYFLLKDMDSAVKLQTELSKHQFCKLIEGDSGDKIIVMLDLLDDLTRGIRDLNKGVFIK